MSATICRLTLFCSWIFLPWQVPNLQDFLSCTRDLVMLTLTHKIYVLETSIKQILLCRSMSWVRRWQTSVPVAAEMGQLNELRLLNNGEGADRTTSHHNTLTLLERCWSSSWLWPQRAVSQLWEFYVLMIFLMLRCHKGVLPLWV